MGSIVSYKVSLDGNRYVGLDTFGHSECFKAVQMRPNGSVLIIALVDLGRFRNQEDVAKYLEGQEVELYT